MNGGKERTRTEVVQWRDPRPTAEQLTVETVAA